MTLSQKLEKLREDWIVIVLSLLAAVFLYVFYQIAQMDTTTFSVPISVESNGNLLLVKEIPSRVKITVKGKTEDISRLTEKDFSAYLNFDYYTSPGEYSVPISLQTSDSVANITSLEIRPNPQSIDVFLEEKTIGYVPITIRTTGNPASGYEIISEETTPDYIRIIGSASSVASVKTLETELWDISNAKSTIEKKLKLINTNKRITIDEEPVVNAKITIEEIVENKVFENTIVTLLNPKEGFEASAPTLKATVTVKGSQNYLKDYKLPYGLLYVDCSSISEPGEYEIDIKNYKLANLSLVSIEPTSLSVTITEKIQDPESENLVDGEENSENSNPEDTLVDTENSTEEKKSEIAE